MMLKPYPKYKASGIQWIGEIPEGWEVRKLKHICIKYAEYGLNISSDKYQTEGIRFIRTTDIDDYGNLENGGVYLNRSLCKGYTLNSGDLLISRSGTIGRTFLFNSKKNDKATYAGYLVRFSINKNKAIPKYIFYFTKTNSFYGWLEIQSIETTIENVNGQKYANLLLTIPPLPDQTTIANFLDKKNAKINSLIEKDKKLIALLKEKRTALINHAVTKGLDPNVKLKDSGIAWIGEIPGGWEVIKLKFIADERKEKERDGKEKPLLGLENIESSTTKIIEYNSTENIEGESLKFEKNDVLFGKLRPYLAKVALVDRDGCCTSELIVYKSSKKILPKFLMYKLVSKKNIDYVNSLTYGVKMPRADPNTLSNIKQSIPPFEEEQKIAQYLNKATSKIDKTIQKIEEKIKLLEEYKKSLIHYVVTGKVDVRGVEA